MNIIIVNTVPIEFDETFLNKAGLGGSETWAIQLANSFVKKNHQVTVISHCKSHTASNGVVYISNSELDDIVTSCHFDLCIISRCYANYIEVIDEFHMADNVFVQAHDVSVYGNDFNGITTLPCFKGVSTLSAYQERVIHEQTGLNWKYLFRIGNGIDPTLFENINCEPKNKNLLFSSAYWRGADIIEHSILPKLGGICMDVCSYEKIENVDSNGVNVLGSLNKEKLYYEMGQRYCWFYPSVFTETFCITMIENVMCDNDLILPMDYGMSSVLEPYVNDISMKYRFNKDDNEYWMAVDESIYRINESINNRDKNKELRRELKNYVLNKYTWDIIANKWLQLI